MIVLFGEGFKDRVKTIIIIILIVLIVQTMTYSFHKKRRNAILQSYPIEKCEVFIIDSEHKKFKCYIEGDILYKYHCCFNEEMREGTYNFNSRKRIDHPCREKFREQSKQFFNKDFYNEFMNY